MPRQLTRCYPSQSAKRALQPTVRQSHSQQLPRGHPRSCANKRKKPPAYSSRVASTLKQDSLKYTSASPLHERTTKLRRATPQIPHHLTKGMEPHQLACPTSSFLDTFPAISHFTTTPRQSLPPAQPALPSHPLASHPRRPPQSQPNIWP